MNPYEREQMEAVMQWQTMPPPPAARWFGRAAGPATRAIQNAVPTEVLSFAISGLQTVGSWLQGHKRFLKDAGVEDLNELQQGALERCDELAEQVRRRAALIGGGLGGVFGIAGPAGLVADVPTLLTMAFRTIERIGLCYGETDSSQPAQKRLHAAIFALISANTPEEKVDALRQFQDAASPRDDGTVLREGVERAAERELAKDAATNSLNNLANTLTSYLGRRKSAFLVPFLGAAIGSSVNAWYLYDVATVARYCYQERWLRRRYPDAFQTLDAAEAILPPPPDMPDDKDK